ncbi:hypothetical protein ACP3WT_26540, partial [Salmonella enterica]|uniref:hypothetical protein n=1 Tax=Salmonella enterica TaxID=28901 RepID=UPI003CED2EF3
MPKVTPLAAAETLPDKPVQKPAMTAVEASGNPLTAVAMDQTALSQDPERGIAAGGWDLAFSPYT